MAMPLNIKNERAHDLARQVAERTGESLTTAVVHALEEKLQRLNRRTSETREQRIARLTEMALEIANMPTLDPRTPDEILGYDENGLPS